ncbi:MAG: hypothetical protein ACLSG5_15290 [Oscillospiraceae bacterium]
MKKRNCRMTGEEKNVHERAVKLRKMTDDKLVEHIDHIREEAYNTGYSEAEAQRASTPAPGKTLPQLLEQLDAGECKGIKARPPQNRRVRPRAGLPRMSGPVGRSGLQERGSRAQGGAEEQKKPHALFEETG